jgi:hypothetical protein
VIDQILSLAFSVHSNKGIYALLLGSGISRPAGIPTGWEVVLDLINRIASMHGENCEPDPTAWYKDKFGEDPEYSKILDAIAKSPTERSQLLKGYFEPKEEEREQGLKVPTVAHKAIADLVANGYIRVIITTNFDRLLEKALEAVGIVPTVISTPDAIEGALPLTHTECTVIKVNGDYLDIRIKNTPAELESYDEPLNQLLDRIFDEFGLIVCGWSAEWDTALRAALERCQSHRFTTYWATRGETKEIAKRVIQLRRAEVIRIHDADSFFSELEQKVSALHDLDRPHPLSPKVAVATLKKYLPDDRYRIQLNDLVMQETEKLYRQLSGEHFPVDVRTSTHEEFELCLQRRVQRYEALTETLQALLITGCYWGEETHEELWARCLERIANPPVESRGIEAWLDLRYYPALLLLYAGGLASIAAKRYSNFAALLTKARVIYDRQSLPSALFLYPDNVMNKGLAERLSGMERHHTPLSDHLQQVLREPLREYLPQDEHYQKCFDRFEYLFALVHADLREKQESSIAGPLGCFLWRNRRDPENHIAVEIELEIKDAGDNWPPLKVGLFDDSLERFRYLKREFDSIIRGVRLG